MDNRQNGNYGREPSSAPLRKPQNTARGNVPPRRNPQGRPSQPQNRQADLGNYSKYVSAPVQTTKTRRNYILALCAVILIVLTIVIIIMQSCKDRNTETVADVTEKSVVTTVKAGKSAEISSGLFAEYTDNTKALNVKSDYGILIDLEKNEVIADKKGEAKIFPASMTKVMTLIVAYEHIEDLEDTFTFDAEMLNPLFAANASQAGFLPGESAKLIDMLYGAILPSGADATVGLARYVAGSEEAFAELMNEKAKELGLKNTHFVTVSGLHDNNHYSTCHDMAVILRYAIRNEDMRNILATYQYTTSPSKEHPEGIKLTSTLYNRMEGDESGTVYVMGGKTGYTNEGRNCLMTFAANCTEEMAPQVDPQYILVTASAWGEYTPVFDAIDVYKNYCKN